MRFEVVMRFVLGLLIGASIWAVSHRARADSIPATANTQTQPATQTTVTKYSSNGSTWYDSVGAMQSAFVAARNAAHAPCSTNGSGTAYETATAGPIYSTYFQWKSTCGPYPDGTYAWVDLVQNVSFSAQNFTEYQCPSGWNLSGTNCTQTTYSCPTGYTLSGTMCNQNALPAGQSCGNIAIPETASPGAGGCANGTLCYFNEASNQYAIGGVQVWYGPAVSSGQTCSGQPQAMSGSQPDTSCPPGKVPGTINGQTQCFTASEDKPAVKVETTSQTTTDPQGQTTQGPTTTTTTTDSGSGGTMTQTTTRNPDGSSTQTTQNGGPQDSRPDMQRFCDENPNAPVCKNSTWAGSCGAFSCDGDAVECAISLEQHQRNCALFDTPSSLSTLGNQVSTGADPEGLQNPALETNRQSVSLPNSLSQDPFLAPGGLTDQQITVTPSLTVTLPWSQLNYYLSLMGAIVVAFALVAAARIVIGVR